ncbi:MAG: glycosyltransferase N-terminal domain-containing protein, partial [Gammaproteobacteria bacterium]|nr:glycosyltransferase N-terminal domain-containing protein [Gammaproteobacteria bacterium]
MRVLYYLVIGILFPFFLASSAIRAWRQTRSADPTLQRLGHVDRAPSGPVIWVHASSVGEMQAAIPLVRSLQADYPETHIVVSSFTAAGMQRARAAFGETVQVCPLPYDFPRFARRFLNRIRPLALIVMETEIWPSLFRLCGERRIPVLLASARVTARSTRRYARLGSLLRESLESVQLVAAQSEGDAHRFAELGVHASRIKVSGNLKFDLEPSAEIIEQGRAMRQLLFGAAPVLIAASTRIGEDEAVLEAFRQVREKQADARLLI